MVEGTGLENRHTGNGIVSSNLTLSVVVQQVVKVFGRAVVVIRGGAFCVGRGRDGWPSGLRRTPGKRVGS